MARAATATRRADSQARTRQLVLEAAERLFLANGFGATSLEDIAREAGFSKGAVYSNFAGKTDLFFAIVEQQFVELAARSAQAVDGRGRRAGPPRRGRHLVPGVPPGRVRLGPVAPGGGRPRRAGRRRPRRASAASSSRSRPSIAELTAQQQESLGIQFGLPPEQVSALIVALVIGLAVRSLHDLESPPELFNNALARFLLPL